MPEDVQDVFGSALLDAQHGDTPEGARPFGEGVSSTVWKLVEDHDRDTYRAAYTVAFEKAVYVLHVFKKKSKSGIATPKPDKDRIEERLKAARAHYKLNYGG
jgi:phage-related protein